MISRAKDLAAMRIAAIFAAILGWHVDWHNWWITRYNAAADRYNAKIDAPTTPRSSEP